MLRRGDRVADYTISDYLGSGGSSDVFRVLDADGNVAALKMLRPDAARRPDIRERFDNEYRLASLLNHPHIVATYDHGETPDRRPWMLMQYVDGNSSAAMVPTRSSEPDVAFVTQLAVQIADALDYTHSRLVLHGDVKPGNILVSRAPGWAGLTDFGIAQQLDGVPPESNGWVRGSISYTAPELLQAQRLSPATDQYALACTVFELLTGTPPFVGNTTLAIIHAHIHAPYPRLDRRRRWIPSPLNAVFAKALAKTPDKRYPTCAEFARVVAAILRGIEPPIR
ncbi:putative serine/threonine protein kinase [Gordonia effusa NBRC 100432]|uniref:non-specific serine/threonine protein kinase n=1 Tax=Gordonia effusa NBRC 100432 TaxID=1077974 RepID=H0R0V0_9ACTN|nr:serine/threonine-protein kinase [Gordonia effusa]GAB18701.1 putative serine/threonine protein kinase [Gordonia effusa NBRC 100432]